MDDSDESGEDSGDEVESESDPEPEPVVIKKKKSKAPEKPDVVVNES